MGESESESESEEDVRQGLLKPQKRKAVESSGGRTKSAVSDDSVDEQETLEMKKRRRAQRIGRESSSESPSSATPGPDEDA